MCVLLATSAMAQPNSQPLPERNWVPGRLIVRAHGPEFVSMMEAEIRSLGLAVMSRSRSGERLALAVPVGHEQDIRQHLKGSDWAKWVIQDYMSEGGMEFDPPPSEMPAPTTGTPHPHNLWFLENTGQTITDYQNTTLIGTPGADIDILQAWERSQGDSSILVAILDSGIDKSHPEFAGRLYTHELVYTCPAPTCSPQPCTPACPSISNLWPCCSGSGCTFGDASESQGHGTAVASVLAANTNNGGPATSPSLNDDQFAGVDPSCTLVIVRVSHFNQVSFGTVMDVLEDLYYDSRFEDVRVINFSLNGFDCPV